MSLLLRRRQLLLPSPANAVYLDTVSNTLSFFTGGFSYGLSPPRVGRRIVGITMASRLTTGDNFSCVVTSARFFNGSDYINATIHDTDSSISDPDNESVSANVFSAIVPTNDYNQIEITHNNAPTRGTHTGVFALYKPSAALQTSDLDSTTGLRQNYSWSVTSQENDIIIAARGHAGNNLMTTWNKGVEVDNAVDGYTASFMLEVKAPTQVGTTYSANLSGLPNRCSSEALTIWR